MTLSDSSTVPLAKSTYLGDGVYARYGEHGIEIWVSNGVDRSSSIFLELSTYKALHAYAAGIWRLRL
jgi:hypothetical protein